MTETVNKAYRHYFFEDTNEIRYLDPVLGTELSAHEPPPSLALNPITEKGLAQLREIASEGRLEVQLVQGYHLNATDFPDMVESSGDALSQATLIASELSWRSTTTEPRLSSLKIDQKASVGPKEFHESQISWLTAREKTILPCDLPVDDDKHGQPYRSYRDVLTLIWEANKSGDERSENILWGVFQTVREWMFLAHLGYWLNDLVKTGELSKGQLKIPFISGLFHTGFADKLNDLGIPSERHAITRRTTGKFDGDLSERRLFHFTTTNTVIPQQELARLLADVAKPDDPDPR